MTRARINRLLAIFVGSLLPLAAACSDGTTAPVHSRGPAFDRRGAEPAEPEAQEPDDENEDDNVLASAAGTWTGSIGSGANLQTVTLTLSNVRSFDQGAGTVLSGDIVVTPAVSPTAHLHSAVRGTYLFGVLNLVLTPDGAGVATTNFVAPVTRAHGRFTATGTLRSLQNGLLTFGTMTIVLQ
jgi:hypothetical protein